MDITKEKLQEELNIHTLKEVAKIYKVFPKTIKELAFDWDLDIPWEARTKYSHSLMKDKGFQYKYYEKHKDKLKQESEQEILEHNRKSYKKHLADVSWETGSQMAIISGQIDNLLRQLEKQQRIQFLCDVLDKVTWDTFGDFVDEEHNAKLPKVEAFDLNLLNDEMAIGYLTNKYGLQVGAELMRILGKNEGNK